MNSLQPTAKTRAKTARDAFRLLLQRTERRVEGGTRSPATLAMQRQHARYLLERIGPRTLVDQLTPRRIARLLEQEGKGRRWPLSAGTLRKRASTLSQAIEIVRGRAPRLPEIPHTYKPQVAFLQDLAAYERLRDDLTPEQRLWFVVAVWTGQRYSDVERMRREDFDPDQQFVVVRSTKTGRTAGVRIHAGAELVRGLRAHWEQLPAGAKLVPAWPHANTTLKGACKRLGLPRISTKGLRHTFFTWYVAANGFTAELLEIGGWADLTMRARVYAHALPVRFRSQIDRTFAMAKSLRLGPRKSFSAESAAKKVGRPVLQAPAAPDTRPEGLVHGTGLNARPPDVRRQTSKRSVGPAGFEPAASGLKVRKNARVTGPFEAETPSEGLCDHAPTTAAAPPATTP